MRDHLVTPPQHLGPSRDPSRPLGFRARQRLRAHERRKAELAKHKVTKLEDRLCDICRRPVEHDRLGMPWASAHTCACLRDECQDERRRRMNRAACRRAYQRRVSRPGYRKPPTKRWPEHPCAREGCKNVTTNRLLCTQCWKDEDRGT